MLAALGRLFRKRGRLINDVHDMLRYGEQPPRRGLARERFFLVRSVKKNHDLLEDELSQSPSRGHCCDWCGASGLARSLDRKLNRQYGRLAVLDLKLGIPEDADHNRRWRAEQRREHGHTEFFSGDQWRAATRR